MNEELFNSELNEYKKNNDKPTCYTKQLYWNLALGLQKVDGLNPSKYLLDNLENNINGKISDEDFEKMLKKYYSDKNLNNKKISEEYECDLVSSRIVNLISDSSFSLHPTSLKTIHKYLFDGIYEFAGKYRDYNISKEKIIKHISKFTSRIWEVHPFGEGNTRTTAVLIVKYLRSLGFEVNNVLFKENSVYFRNALVRSNYNNPLKNISSTDEYLIKFYENLTLGKNHELKSRDLIVKDLFN